MRVKGVCAENHEVLDEGMGDLTPCPLSLRGEGEPDEFVQ